MSFVLVVGTFCVVPRNGGNFQKYSATKIKNFNTSLDLWAIGRAKKGIGRTGIDFNVKAGALKRPINDFNLKYRCVTIYIYL
jgi:hypothetical protein